MDGFRQHLIDAGLAPRSVELYSSAVAWARTWATKMGEPLDAILGVALSPSRLDTFRKALLHWARFTEDEEFEARLRDAKVAGSTRRSRPVRSVSLDEWNKLRAAVQELPEGGERAALVLVSTSGLRVAEVLQLTREQLESALEHGTVDITLKGGDTGPFHLVSDEQRSAAEALVGCLRPGLEVWSVVGRRCTSLDSASRRLRTTLERLGREVGCRVRLSPHVLRRAVGDAVRVASGGDMKLVQEALHHRRLETTLRSYQDHGHPEEVRRAMKAALEKPWSEEA